MTTAQQEVKNLKKDISEIKNLLADQLEDVPVNGSSKIVPSKGELKRVAHQAGKGLRTFISEKQDQIGEAKTACESTIKKRPFTSAAVAFAGGVLLTTLLKRK
jgi:ElaB/YqjD/DUF883 family membrane-anchored ribosome-binding protein